MKMCAAYDDGDPCPLIGSGGPWDELIEKFDCGRSSEQLSSPLHPHLIRLNSLFFGQKPGHAIAHQTLQGSVATISFFRESISMHAKVTLHSLSWRWDSD